LVKKDHRKKAYRCLKTSLSTFLNASEVASIFTGNPWVLPMPENYPPMFEILYDKKDKKFKLKRNKFKWINTDNNMECTW